MLRIVDFMETYSEYNLGRRFPKGTNVVFKLPRREQFDVDDQKVQTAVGYIYSHDESGYEILFENEYIHVPYGDVMVTVAELDKCPIADSVVSAMPFMVSDNENTFVKKLIMNFNELEPDEAIDVYSDLSKLFKEIDLDDDTELMLTISDGWDDISENSIHIGEYGGKCLSYQII